MKGINLRSLKRALHPVAKKFAHKPVLSIKDVDQKLAFCREGIEEYFGEFSFLNDYYKLPLKAFRNFSFEDICKLQYSTNILLEGSVYKIFETRPEYEVVRKIMNSMWHWSFNEGTWNELVDAWNGIRRFDLGLNSDFEVRLDYTTGSNQFGMSKYSRTFLDGVLGFLVYYKRKHVMTIGFSVACGRRIFIQQVQLKQQSGNRWLYKFPQNRLEFVIGLFDAYFPDFALYVIDGESLTQKTIEDYKRGLQRAQERVERNRARPEDDHAHCGFSIQRDEDEVTYFQTRINHLMSDSKRLIKFYRDCGKYVLGQSLVARQLIHHQVELV